jgi:exodeoxyribonuclease V gamma subunit
MLIRMLQERKQNRTIKDWVQFVESILENMVCEAENSAEEDHYILTQRLGTYNVLNEYFTDKVSYRVFIHNFLQTLESGAGTGSFVSSGITFCSLIPMRSIPFRVVAMLGLNFDQFPRKDHSVSFNLMDTKKQKGDRSMKENDKNLFLESLVAAEEFFYISYVGRNSKDNSDFPPSVLVDELVDYIQSGTKEPNVRKLLIKKHPLHGFSRLYNQDDERLITYLNTETPSIPDLMESKEMDSEIISEVSLEKFIHFFKNPFKGYYNDVLKIYYEEDDVLLSENELFELGGLEKWALQNELLSERGDDILIKDKMVKTGQLPLKNMGQIIVENMEEEISDLKELFQKCVKGNPRRTKTIEVAIGDVSIKGQLDLYGNKLVMVCFSKQDQKYRMEAYIKYLAAIAAGEKVELYFISQMKSNCYRAANIEKEEAQKRLNKIMNQYQKGHQSILPFYLDFNFSTNAINKLDEDQFRKNVNAKLLDTFHPCSDPYILNEFNNGFFEKESILKNYQSVAADLLEPLAEIFPDYK